MNQNFTSNDLLLNAYNELDSFTQAQLELAMKENEELHQEYEDIEHVLHHLDADSKKPHKSSIDIILSYSRNSNKERQEELVV